MERRNVHISQQTFAEEWLVGKTEQVFLKNLLNAYNVLVPDSEHFIIRSVRKYKPRLSESLQNDVKILFFQEGQHARETHKADTWLQKSYRISTFKKIGYGLTYAWIEKILPTQVLLAVASAVEHINTTTADYFLTTSGELLSIYPASIRKIYYWHFAEEIEHKAVVFDVLNEISSSQTIRTVGMILAAMGFVFLLVIGSFVLSAQDRSLFRKSFWKDFGYFLGNKNGLLHLWWKRIAQYTRKKFHPNDIDNTHLIAEAITHFEALSKVGEP